MGCATMAHNAFEQRGRLLDEDHPEENRWRQSDRQRRRVHRRGRQGAQLRASGVRPADEPASRAGQDGRPGRRGAHGHPRSRLRRDGPGAGSAHALRRQQDGHHPGFPAQGRSQVAPEARPDLPVRGHGHPQARLRADLLRPGHDHRPAARHRPGGGRRADRPDGQRLHRVRARRSASGPEGRRLQDRDEGLPRQRRGGGSAGDRGPHLRHRPGLHARGLRRQRRRNGRGGDQDVHLRGARHRRGRQRGHRRVHDHRHRPRDPEDGRPRDRRRLGQEVHAVLQGLRRHAQDHRGRPGQAAREAA